MAHGGCRCSSGCANPNLAINPNPNPNHSPNRTPNQVQLRLRDDPEDPDGYWWSPLLGGSGSGGGDGSGSGGGSGGGGGGGGGGGDGGSGGGGGGGGSGGRGGDGHAVEWLPAEGALPPAWAQSSWHEPKLLAFDLVGISPGGRRRGRFHRVSAYEALEAARLRSDAP